MSVVAGPTFEQSALLLAWIAIVLLAFAMSGLLRQVYALHLAVIGRGRLGSGPAVGTVAPRIAGLNGRNRALLLFVDPGCSPCEEALARLAERAGSGFSDVTFAVVHKGQAPEQPNDGIVTVSNAERIFSDLGVTITPLAVALDARRRVVASAPVGSPELVDQFVDFVAREEGAADDREH